ncbi:MAG TPA: trehalase family glycosidase [Patescibacteria group bacterium]|nr:trehalase family glycosidase [Patescibacteria group bacterium]
MSFDSKILKECLSFIDDYWEKITYNPSDTEGDPHIIPLPHPFISPVAKGTSHWKGTLFYWDTFFMFRGLVGTKREWLMPGTVDNFIYLFKTYGVVPNANFWAFLMSSQAPFLSSMVFDSYYAIQRGGTNIQEKAANNWLKERIEAAKEEYFQVWEDSKHYNHKVEQFNLSKYGDRDVGYNLNAERESGWDFTTRFYNRCHEFLPIDLNSYLHKYEKDFAKAAHLLGNEKEEKEWDKKAQDRHDRIKKYMWNEEKGFFFDYDFVHELQSEFYSLAGFVPLWAKLATYEEAKRAREKLPLFETEYGLTITAKESLPPQFDYDNIPDAFRYSIEEVLKPKQWDYPHIWSPLEYQTIIGLLRYGFIDDAVRIMTKSISANLKVFQKYGALLEKLDATTGGKPKTFWYPAYLGFGWTNAVFYRYVKLLEHIEKHNKDIYTKEALKLGPPYSLTGILH